MKILLWCLYTWGCRRNRDVQLNVDWPTWKTAVKMWHNGNLDGFTRQFQSFFCARQWWNPEDPWSAWV